MLSVKYTRTYRPTYIHTYIHTYTPFQEIWCNIE